jgi:hypothetical protein
MFTHVSEECNTSVFGIEEKAKKAADRGSACYLLSLFFDPEEGGNTFL